MTGRMVHNGTAKLYRGVTIGFSPEVRQGRPGRYTVNGRPFAQLCQARDYIDGQAGKGAADVLGLL